MGKDKDNKDNNQIVQRQDCYQVDYPDTSDDSNDSSSGPITDPTPTVWLSPQTTEGNQFVMEIEDGPVEPQEERRETFIKAQPDNSADLEEEGGRPEEHTEVYDKTSSSAKDEEEENQNYNQNYNEDMADDEEEEAGNSMADDNQLRADDMEEEEHEHENTNDTGKQEQNQGYIVEQEALILQAQRQEEDQEIIVQDAETDKRNEEIHKFFLDLNGYIPDNIPAPQEPDLKAGWNNGDPFP